MHFKSAVIFCAVYFFASARSIGLNKQQIQTCVGLYKTTHNAQPYIVEAEIINFMEEDVEVGNPEKVFKYNPREPNYINLTELFVALAYEDKKIFDSFEVAMLTPFEVHFFLSEFIAHVKHFEQDGFLTRHQLQFVFEHLQFKTEEKEMAEHLINTYKATYRINVNYLSFILSQIQPEIKMRTFFKEKSFIDDIVGQVENYDQKGSLTYEQLTSVFKYLDLNIIQIVEVEKISGCTIDPAEFLCIMMEILPQGNGLNPEQIQYFIELYKYHVTKSPYPSIEPLKIKQLFIDFGMATEAHNELMVFRSDRPAAKELMELLIVTAERSRKTDKVYDVVISTQDVRSLITVFTKYDTDDNGLLSKDEVDEFIEVFIRSSDPQVLTAFKFDGDSYKLLQVFRFIEKDVNVAEFLMFYVIYQRNIISSRQIGV